MTYRDERDALHARNEALEREISALRAKLASQATPPRPQRSGKIAVSIGLLATVAGGMALTMLNRAPQPAPSPEHREPNTASPPRAALTPTPAPAPRSSSPYAELANARSGSMESIARMYRGVVTHASPGAPVRAATACTVHLRRAGNICWVDARCGDWGPYPNAAITVCTIDEQGLPHGGIHMGPTTGQPTAIQMDGTRFEVSDERPGQAYLVTLRLDEVTAEPLTNPVSTHYP